MGGGFPGRGKPRPYQVTSGLRSRSMGGATLAVALACGHLLNPRKGLPPSALPLYEGPSDSLPVKK